MTMRELMTHTGGLAYGLVGSHAVDKLYLKAGPAQSAPAAAVAGRRRSPRCRWWRSRAPAGRTASAVDVQGYLVEKLSGQSFADFLRTRLFEPLKMTDTGFFVPKEKLSRLALIHGEDASGTLTPPDDSRGDPTQVPVAAFGGHGLFSTAADYARFCEMILGGGELGGSAHPGAAHRRDVAHQPPAGRARSRRCGRAPAGASVRRW